MEPSVEALEARLATAWATGAPGHKSPDFCAPVLLTDDPLKWRHCVKGLVASRGWVMIGRAEVEGTSGVTVYATRPGLTLADFRAAQGLPTAGALEARLATAWATGALGHKSPDFCVPALVTDDPGGWRQSTKDLVASRGWVMVGQAEVEGTSGVTVYATRPGLTLADFRAAQRTHEWPLPDRTPASNISRWTPPDWTPPGPIYVMPLPDWLLTC